MPCVASVLPNKPHGEGNAVSTPSLLCSALPGTGPVPQPWQQQAGWEGPLGLGLRSWWLCALPWGCHIAFDFLREKKHTVFQSGPLHKVLVPS